MTFRGHIHKVTENPWESKTNTVSVSTGGNISPLHRVHVSCHRMSPKLWPHPTASSVSWHLLPDPGWVSFLAFPSRYWMSQNHNTVVLPFCRSAQKIEFTLGTWGKKLGERTWELSFLEPQGLGCCSGGLCAQGGWSWWEARVSFALFAVALMCH